jgi:hypothetical protein
MPLMDKKCKRNGPLSQLKITAQRSAPHAFALTYLQRVQFLVARNTQKDRPEFRRGFFTENILEASFGVPPQASRSVEHRLAFFRQLDVSLAPIDGR